MSVRLHVRPAGHLLIFRLSVLLLTEVLLPVLRLRAVRPGAAPPEQRDDDRGEIPERTSPLWLSYLDSNQERQNQNLLCYRYTIAQSSARKRLQRYIKIQNIQFFDEKMVSGGDRISFFFYFSGKSRAERVRSERLVSCSRTSGVVRASVLPSGCGSARRRSPSYGRCGEERRFPVPAGWEWCPEMRAGPESGAVVRAVRGCGRNRKTPPSA